MPCCDTRRKAAASSGVTSSGKLSYVGTAGVTLGVRPALLMCILFAHTIEAETNETPQHDRRSLVAVCSNSTHLAVEPGREPNRNRMWLTSGIGERHSPDCSRGPENKKRALIRPRKIGGGKSESALLQRKAFRSSQQSRYH